MSKALLKTIEELTEKVQSFTKRYYFLVDVSDGKIDQEIDKLITDGEFLDIQICILKLGPRLDEI